MTTLRPTNFDLIEMTLVALLVGAFASSGWWVYLAMALMFGNGISHEWGRIGNERWDASR